MAPQDFNYWLNTVRGSTRGLSDEQEMEAAGICTQTNDDDAPVGTWHAASMACGNVAMCQCARCRRSVIL